MVKTLTKKHLKHNVRVISSVWNDNITLTYIGERGFIFTFTSQFVDVAIKGKIITFNKNELELIP